MNTVSYTIMRLRFMNHSSLVALAEQLADDLVPFHFETDSGESVLAFDFDRCPETTQMVIEEYLNWGDAEITLQ